MLIRLLISTLLTLSCNLFASDLAKEKRWADQVVDAIMDGESVWLNDGQHDFLGIYTPAEENKGRAVIVMHGTGVHPDWQQVVQPLRVGLTEHQWNTLSIQMPILANEAEHAEYAAVYGEVAPRINAAVQYLKNHGSQDIVLIGHSQGATMAAYYLTQSKQDFKGFIAIGMSSFGKDPRMDGVKSLQKITLPVLDLYGNEDLDSVISTISARKSAAATAGNKNFTQVKITGNHFYDGQEEQLVETVADWLETL